MRQRVMIAMALACRPAAAHRRRADHRARRDHPGADPGADPLSCSSESGMAVVLITHDLGVVAEMARARGRHVPRAASSKPTTSTAFSGTRRHPYTARAAEGRAAPGRHARPQNPATLPVLDMERELKRGPGDGAPAEKEIDTADYGTTAGPGSPQPDDPLRVEKTFFGRPTHLVYAVENVSFRLYPGETLGIVGESGCGKTTTGYSALSASSRPQGEVLFDGQDIMAVS
ncbi:MAG: ATP-binding cassette domain-containing protein [Desulfobacterales bacterium]|nr:ATP-binding cassette domain-containing protein [Desulfobacterales bacterium]